MQTKTTIRNSIALLLAIFISTTLAAQQSVVEYKMKNLISHDVLEQFRQINTQVQMYNHKEANSIILVGEDSQIDLAIQQLELLDTRQDMVTVEFMLVEYLHNNAYSWGVDIETGQTGNFGGISYTPGSIGVDFNPLTFLSPKFRVNLTALVNEAKAKILTNPHLVVQSGEPAELHLKDERYFQVQTATINGITVQFQQLSAGIDLFVTPVPTSDSIIHLDVHGTISEFLPLTIGGTGGSTLTEEHNEIKTKVDVKDGQTLIIGGLVQEEVLEVDAGIPGLRKIPLLGLLFKKKEKIKLYIERVLYITPYLHPVTDEGHYQTVRKPTPLEQSTQEIIESDPEFIRYERVNKAFKKRRNGKGNN